MPTTYLCEAGFSTFVEIKRKKPISIKDVDPLRKNAFETVETTFLTTGGWNSASATTANEIIYFLIQTGCDKTS